jgi:hypothetical protein
MNDIKYCFKNQLFAVFAMVVLSLSASANATQPLPSWNEGATKTAILAFVAEVTDKNSKNYVQPADRIATFDNDGTLWVEYPMYTQVLFAFEKVKKLAPSHPEWKTTLPFKALLEGDMKTVGKSGMKGLMEILMATHSGMTVAEFKVIADNWLGTARHPTTGRAYTEMVYQPMLELLAYLRANDFKTYITSGGGIEMIRIFAEDVYGIPPEQVIGSSLKTQFEYRNNDPALVRLPELDFIDDKEGKPVAINQHIGRRPIAAFGNSDGDLQMLQWTCAGEGARFCLYVHHTDADREWAYDRDSHIGRLDKGLSQAKSDGWTVVDMAADWKTVFPRIRIED